MRYYRIVLTNPDGSVYRFRSLGAAIDPASTVSSLLPSGPQNPTTGLTNPAALQIEMDLNVSPTHDPTGQGLLTIRNLGLEDVSRAADLTGLGVQIYGGMAKGLPLANPNQAGLLLAGQVFTSWGMWYGDQQFVTLNIIPGGKAVGSNANPQNFPVSWQAGTPLSQAIAQTLSVALPGLTQNISISPNLVLNHASIGHYGSLTQFSDAINTISTSLLGGTTGYAGVHVFINGTTVTVTDWSQPASGTGAQVNPWDIIGQPTWVAPNQMSVQMVMRADIHGGDTITLPNTVFQIGSGAQTTPGNANLPQNKLTFSGQVNVVGVRHLGDFRQEDGTAWNTTYTCNFVSAG